MLAAYKKNMYTSSLYAIMVVTFGAMLLNLVGTVEAFSEMANETFSIICDSNLTTTNNLEEDMFMLVD